MEGLPAPLGGLFFVADRPNGSGSGPTDTSEGPVL